MARIGQQSQRHVDCAAHGDCDVGRGRQHLAGGDGDLLEIHQGGGGAQNPSDRTERVADRAGGNLAQQPFAQRLQALLHHDSQHGVGEREQDLLGVEQRGPGCHAAAHDRKGDRDRGDRQIAVVDDLVEGGGARDGLAGDQEDNRDTVLPKTGQQRAGRTDVAIPVRGAEAAEVEPHGRCATQVELQGGRVGGNRNAQNRVGGRDRIKLRLVADRISFVVQQLVAGIERPKIAVRGIDGKLVCRVDDDRTAVHRNAVVVRLLVHRPLVDRPAARLRCRRFLRSAFPHEGAGSCHRRPGLIGQGHIAAG